MKTERTSSFALQAADRLEAMAETWTDAGDQSTATQVIRAVRDWSALIAEIADKGIFVLGPDLTARIRDAVEMHGRQEDDLVASILTEWLDANL